MLSTGGDRHHPGTEHGRRTQGAIDDHRPVGPKSHREPLTRRHRNQIGPRGVEDQLSVRVVAPALHLHPGAWDRHKHGPAANGGHRVANAQFIGAGVGGADRSSIPDLAREYPLSFSEPLVHQRLSPDGIGLQFGRGALRGPDADRRRQEFRRLHHDHGDPSGFMLTQIIGDHHRVPARSLGTGGRDAQLRPIGALDPDIVVIPGVVEGGCSGRLDREPQGASHGKLPPHERTDDARRRLHDDIEGSGGAASGSIGHRDRHRNGRGAIGIGDHGCHLEEPPSLMDRTERSGRNHRGVATGQHHPQRGVDRTVDVGDGERDATRQIRGEIPIDPDQADDRGCHGPDDRRIVHRCHLDRDGSRHRGIDAIPRQEREPVRAEEIRSR